MIRIALTGPSGAGKGYVAKLLEKRGIAVLDTDSVVHELYAEADLPILISKMFGDEVLSSDGSVNRKALGAIVFQDKEALSALNRVVHEAVKRKTEQWLQEKQKSGAEMAAVDAPQLFEAGMQGDFDLVVSVIADEKNRLYQIEAARRSDENSFGLPLFDKIGDGILMDLKYENDQRIEVNYGE